MTKQGGKVHDDRLQDYLKAVARVDVESAMETVIQIPVNHDHIVDKKRDYAKKAYTIPGSGKKALKELSKADSASPRIDDMS